MLVVAADGSVPALLKPRQLFIVGFTPRDLLCLGFIDRFFADGLRDDIYFRKREGAVIAAVSGYTGLDGGFVPLSGYTGLPPFQGEGRSEVACDLEFVFDGAGWIVIPYSQAGRSITELITSEAAANALTAVIEKSVSFANADTDLIQSASELLLAEKVPDSFWEEVAAACILCTGCNLVCPTCTCFGVQDWRYPGRVERSRMWDSCQLDGFMREAGGHNPLGTDALRTRRRIHHKLAADKTRWGEISCFLCGRCDAVCPTGIGMMAVAKRIVDRFG